MSHPIFFTLFYDIHQIEKTTKHKANFVSLIAASSSGIVTLAFAAKKRGTDPTGSSSNKKDTSTTGSSSTTTGSKSKFIKCVTGISGSISRTEVDNCWDKVFGGGGESSSGSRSTLTLGPSTSSGSSSSSVHRVDSTGASNT